MSSVVKTVTPFILKDLLIEALAELNCLEQVQGERIITRRTDIRGNQYFERNNGQYVLIHDSHDTFLWGNPSENKYKSVKEFLAAVERIYTKKYQELQEKLRQEELERIEAERKAFVESQKKAILERAKEKGYSVKEQRVGEKTKLVLVRHTY